MGYLYVFGKSSLIVAEVLGILQNPSETCIMASPPKCYHTGSKPSEAYARKLWPCTVVAYPLLFPTTRPVGRTSWDALSHSCPILGFPIRCVLTSCSEGTPEVCSEYGEDHQINEDGFSCQVHPLRESTQASKDLWPGSHG